jgi:hypothetical protein
LADARLLRCMLRCQRELDLLAQQQQEEEQED